VLNRLGFLLPPVLAADGDERIARAQYQLGKDELQLVDGSHAGKRRFAVAADHDIVGQVDRQHDDVLQHQRAHQREKTFIERFIFGKHGFGVASCYSSCILR